MAGLRRAAQSPLQQRRHSVSAAGRLFPVSCFLSRVKKELTEGFWATLGAQTRSRVCGDSCVRVTFQPREHINPMTSTCLTKLGAQRAPAGGRGRRPRRRQTSRRQPERSPSSRRQGPDVRWRPATSTQSNSREGRSRSCCRTPEDQPKVAEKAWPVCKAPPPGLGTGQPTMVLKTPGSFQAGDTSQKGCSAFPHLVSGDDILGSARARARLISTSALAGSITLQNELNEPPLFANEDVYLLLHSWELRWDHQREEQQQLGGGPCFT